MIESMLHESGAADLGPAAPDASSDDPTTIAERVRIARIVDRALSAMAPARAKARVSWRERRSLRTLLTRLSERLRADDIRVEGAVRDGRFVVAASGAQPWYDHAFATMAIQLFEADLTHERVAAATEGSRQ